ncbi:hypothetical protein SDRG_10430 [Saprolegnia diclina VS20]|uniref:Uncharacterized protein n=1 Tax=Saprolegnia diclina (strain VS20) TaxID=1156394 RepID=T0RHY3_SAPDV|nr:hypothetical protein SDRG_10430 [Saprolegnia diclina VS20]EQC31913.1 hypothetical protein SDRG_10430 [Saprolegnia diclina VS20]|eukprot:XP_008614641.1 hypothetical protein SDRG_10430 [Saprolegnia diclina VS20]
MFSGRRREKKKVHFSLRLRLPRHENPRGAFTRNAHENTRMETYQHNGRKIIQLIFKSTETGRKTTKEATTGPRLPPTTMSSKPPPTHRDILVRASPSAADVRFEDGPQRALLKAAALKKQKRHPARLPPLRDEQPPAPSRILNNNNNNNNQQSTSELHGPETSSLDSHVLLGDDPTSITITIDEMDKVLGDLQSWRSEHAKKVSLQLLAVVEEASPVTNDTDGDNDATDAELHNLYMKAKARWATVDKWQLQASAPTPGLPPADEAKVQSLLQNSSNVSKLQKLRDEVFQLHVRDLSRQWRESLNNDPEEAAFEANLLELECGVQTYADDLDALLARLDAIQTSVDAHQDDTAIMS